MKKAILSLLPAVIFLLFSSRHASGSHLYGGDITYKAKGNGKFEVSLRVFRDCIGTSVQVNPITITPLACIASGFTAQLPLISTKDVTDICATVPSKCAGGTSPYGIKEYIFRDIIDLSASTYNGCCKFNISWAQAGRTSAITTGPGGQALYVVALLDKCVVPANSSPVLSGNMPVICVGWDYCFNLNAIDSLDHDSLSYELIDPMSTASNPAPFGSGYSKDKPLMFLGSPNKNASLPAGFHLNAWNGNLCFRPVKVEGGVLVIKVTEWRKINGVMTNIGETRRDMVILVTACSSNKSPQITYTRSDFAVCAGTKLCFDILSTDPDPGDTVQLSWSNGIPGATITPYFPTGSIKQNAQFCWTPADSDVLATPHSFLATATDNSCPVSGTGFMQYTVKVKSITATRKITNRNCGVFSFDATPSSSGVYNYTWMIKKDTATIIYTSSQKNFTYAFNDPGKYLIAFSITDTSTFACPKTYVDTLQVDSFLVLQLPADTALCTGVSIQINATVSKGKPPYSYQWNTGVADTFPVINTIMDTSVLYKLTISDANTTCSDSILIRHSEPQTNAGSDVMLCIFDAPYSLPGTPAGGSWSGPGTTTNGRFDPAISGVGTFYPVYRYSDSFSCQAFDTAMYTVLPIPFVSAGKDTLICPSDTLFLKGSPSGGIWYGDFVNGNTFVMPPGHSGATMIFYEIANKACYATDTLIVDIRPSSINAGADTGICSNGSPVTLTGIPAGGTWAGNGVSGNTFNPNGLTGLQKVSYAAADNLGCVYIDEKIISILLPPANVKAGSNLMFCYNEGPAALVGTPSGGTWSGTGIIANQFNPALAGAGVHTAFYNYIAPNGCGTFDSRFITVKKPVADFNASPDSGAAPLHVQFSDISAGNHSRTWNFGDATSSSNTSTLQQPSHVYNYSGFYTVTLIYIDAIIQNCGDTLTKVNYIQVSGPSGIAGIVNETGIRVFPNPAAGSFEVLLNLQTEGSYTFSMQDILGKEVKMLKDVKAGVLKVQCDDLPAGLYFIEMRGISGEIYRSRVVLE